MNATKNMLGLAAMLCFLGQDGSRGVMAAEGIRSNVTVEVLIFSGRPNPTFQLQETKRFTALEEKLKSLPAASEHEPAEWSRLGFAGFRIHGGESVGLPGEIRVFNGVIKTGHGSAAKYVKDAERLEEALIFEARKQPLAAPVKDALANYENSRKPSNQK